MGMEWKKAVSKNLVAILLITPVISIANERQEQINAAKGFFSRGVESFKYADYENALLNFNQCNTVLIECLHNTGSAYFQLEQKETAAQYYTAAARYGYKRSQDALKEMGKPIPIVDQQLQGESSGSGLGNALSGAINVLNALVGGYNRGADAVLRSRPRNATCTQTGNTIDCYQY